METLSIADLCERSAEVLADLAGKGELLLTFDRRPVALILALNDSNVDEIVRSVRLVRARLALRNIRRQAGEQGLDKLSIAEIQDEIAAAREGARMMRVYRNRGHR